MARDAEVCETRGRAVAECGRQEKDWHGEFAEELACLGDRFSACRTLFAALGDEGNQLIFMSLLRHYGGMRVGEISCEVGLSRAAVSRHLKALRETGLVSSYARGTKTYYHVDGSSTSWYEMVEHSVQAGRLAMGIGHARDAGLSEPRREVFGR